MTRLENGVRFPEMTVHAVGGGNIDLPASLNGSFGVVLVYRGAWCPVCRAQLAAFADAAGELEGMGIKVVAFSVDDEAATKELTDTLNICFPMGHSADADRVAELIGSYVNDDPHYLQPTGVVLSPEGEVLNAVYSSNALGRLTPVEVKGLVEHIRSRPAAK